MTDWVRKENRSSNPALGWAIGAWLGDGLLFAYERYGGRYDRHDI